MVHIPVVGLQDPTDGVTVTPVNPEGIKSLIFIFVAVSGPLFVAVTMNVTLFPE